MPGGAWGSGMKDEQAAGLPVESGPTRERIARTALLLILVGGFGAAFVYDGWHGYLAENFEEHLRSLPAGEREQAREAPVYSAVIQANEAAAKAVLNRIGAAEQRKALVELFGGPPSFESNDAWYYFGPGFRVKYELEGGEARRLSAQPSAKSLTSILWQKVIGILLTAFASAILIHLLRILLTKARLDRHGLHLGRRRSIAWEAMSALEDSRFRKKGWVDLVYAADGETRRIRLDEYHLARFDEIVGGICERKGFVDPVAAEKAEKQQAAGPAAHSAGESDAARGRDDQSN